MKKLLCIIFGHKIAMEIRPHDFRLFCTRCGVGDPYGPHPRHPHNIDNRERP
jgi:Prophage protein (DUF1660)